MILVKSMVNGGELQWGVCGGIWKECMAFGAHWLRDGAFFLFLADYCSQVLASSQY